jgi:putative NADH-flavin reductase
MKIAIVGATGFIGQHIFNEAVSRQHTVTALVRNTAKVATSTKVQALELNLQDSAALSAALVGHDTAVLSVHWEEQDLHKIITAVKASGIKHVLFVGGAASLEVAPGVQLFDTPEFPDMWKATASAARELLNILRGEKELNWTYLSPSAFIEPGERTGKFRLGTDQLLLNEKGESRISNQDFAVAVLDELENPTHKQQRFTVGY